MGDDMPISSKMPPKLPATTGSENTPAAGSPVMPGGSSAGLDSGAATVQNTLTDGSGKIKIFIGENEAVVTSKDKSIDLDSYKGSTQGAISADGGMFFKKSGYGTF
jgi:hypothetical protein